ncbi:MAG: hypothetical protein J6T43_12660 [Prevotella sp.]|nr:hypothetical protein [Prevotella sp.]
MEEIKKVEELLLNWKRAGESNSVYKKEGTIDLEKSNIFLTITSKNNPVGLFIECAIDDKAVERAIDLLEQEKEKL